MHELRPKWIAGAFLGWLLLVLVLGYEGFPFRLAWDFTGTGVFGDSFGLLSAGMASLAALFTLQTLRDSRKENSELREREDRALLQARELGEAQVRCYLSVTEAVMHIDHMNRVAVQLKVRNAGQSPAPYFNWDLNICFSHRPDGPPPHHFTEPRCSGRHSEWIPGPINRGIGRVIAAGEVHETLFQQPHHDPTEREIAEMHAPQRGLQVDVETRTYWTDVFGKSFAVIDTFTGVLLQPVPMTAYPLRHDQTRAIPVVLPEEV